METFQKIRPECQMINSGPLIMAVQSTVLRVLNELSSSKNTSSVVDWLCLPLAKDVEVVVHVSHICHLELDTTFAEAKSWQDLRDQLAYFSPSVHFTEKETGAQEGYMGAQIPYSF